MEFRFETYYNYESLTAMAKALRKVLRRRKSTVMRIFSILVFLVGAYLTISTGLKNGFSFSLRAILSYVALLLILATALWEDSINGFMAQKRVRPGTEEVIAVFGEDGYETSSEAEKYQWNYARPNYLAESKHFFTIIFDANHAQVFDKDEMTGGTQQEFRDFICEKTGLTIQRV